MKLYSECWIHLLQINHLTLILELYNTTVEAVWLSGNVVGHINKVTLRRARLVLRWVTVHEYSILVFNQATQANSAWSSLHCEKAVTVSKMTTPCVGTVRMKEESESGIRKQEMSFKTRAEDGERHATEDCSTDEQ